MADSLKASLLELQEKIDARIIRERVLIFLSALAVIFLMWSFVAQNSLDKKIKDTDSKLAALAAERTLLQTQVAAATQNLMNDPDKPKKAQIEQLKTDIAVISTQLQDVSQNLIKADQLGLVLQEVLQKTTALSLLEVNTLPVRELQLSQVISDGADNPQKTEADNVGVYEHAVELRVAGSFMQVTRFLESLEQLPWRFYWQSLDYKVTLYPSAEITLRVYTLSSEEGLLGVR